MATYEELLKYAQEYRPAQPQQSGLYSPNGMQNEDAYSRMVASKYGQSDRPTKQDEEPGLFGGFFKGATAQGLGVLGNQAEAVASFTGNETAGNIADSVNNYTKQFSRPKEYSAKDIFGSVDKFANYAKDPYGLAYDVGGGFGSTVALAAEAAVLAKALAAAGITGAATAGAGLLSSAARKLGLPYVEKALATEGGQKLIGNLMLQAPLESVSESGGTGGTLTHDAQTGQRLQNVDRDAVRSAMGKDFAGNMAILGASNLVEGAGLGRLLGRSTKGISGKVKHGAEFLATNAGQNAWEEGAQTGADKYARGEIGNFIDAVNPAAWDQEQIDAAAIGGIAGLGQGGAMAGASKAYNTALGRSDNDTADTTDAYGPTQIASPAEQGAEINNSEEFPEAKAIALNDHTANPVDRMRNLQGTIPYEATDGTNCMRTIGLAYAGTPYGDVINVDQVVNVAGEIGQLHDPENYVPHPGDLAVVNNGGHIVMVTENGGTIQNGQSANGIWESNISPAEMFANQGGVKYYISASDFFSDTAPAQEKVLAGGSEQPSYLEPKDEPLFAKKTQNQSKKPMRQEQEESVSDVQIDDYTSENIPQINSLSRSNLSYHNQHALQAVGDFIKQNPKKYLDKEFIQAAAKHYMGNLQALRRDSERQVHRFYQDMNEGKITRDQLENNLRMLKQFNKRIMPLIQSAGQAMTKTSAQSEAVSAIQPQELKTLLDMTHKALSGNEAAMRKFVALHPDMQNTLLQISGKINATERNNEYGTNQQQNLQRQEGSEVQRVRQLSGKNAEFEKGIERTEENNDSKKYIPAVETVESGRKKNKVYGKDVKSVTDAGTELGARFRLVDADELILSNDPTNSGNFAPNKNYPQELQPRNRRTAVNRQEVLRMANTLRPADLEESRNLNNGAPLIDGNNVVMNGNGRSMAITRALKSNSEQGKKYRQYLVENAEKWGLNAEQVKSIKNPVLVRELTDDNAPVDEIINSNAGGVGRSASEAAMADAKALSVNTLGKYVPNESGDLLSADNRAFLQSALADIENVDKARRNSLYQANGEVSQQGINAVRNALFAKAYNNAELLSVMSESTDNNIKNITNAMLNAAPKIATLRGRIAKGTRYNIDIFTPLSEAVSKTMSLRNQGMSVQDYLLADETAMFKDELGEDISNIGKDIMVYLDQNKRSAKRMSVFLSAMADTVDNLGNPNQGKLFGREEPVYTAQEVVDSAIEMTEGGTEDLFVAETVDALYRQAAEKFPGVKDEAVKDRVKEAIQTTLDFGTEEGEIISQVTKDGYKQIELFEDESVRGRQTDNGLQDTKRRDVGRHSKLIGFGLTRSLINNGFEDLAGRTVHSIRELAEISQVLRHPGYEKFHVIYARAKNKNGGTIVYHETVTSGLPNVGNVVMHDRGEKTTEDVFKRVFKNIEEHGADRIYIMHNHPSMNVSPSLADRRLTKAFVQLCKEKEIDFGGHIILDTTKCSVIDKNDKVSEKPIREEAQIHYEIPDMPHETIGIQVYGELLPELTKTIADRSETVAYFIDNRYVIRSVVQLPKGFGDLAPDRMNRYLRYLTRSNYATRVILATGDKAAYKKIEGLVKRGDSVTDAILTGNRASVRTTTFVKDKPYDFFGIKENSIKGRKVLENTKPYQHSTQGAFLMSETESVAQQKEEIRKRYKGTSQWMRAPNGEATNLTEDQWLTVRTSTFKNWFGKWDGEHIALKAKEYLDNSKSVGEITGNEFINISTNDLIDKVQEYYEANGYSKIKNKELGEVSLDRRGIRDSKAHGISRKKIAAYAIVPQVVRDGFVFAYEYNWQNKGHDRAVIVANVTIDKKPYVCEVVVNRSDKRQGFYLHEVEIKENLDGVFRTAINGTPSRSKSIIAQYWKDGKHASKVVDENGEPLVVYHGKDGDFNTFQSGNSAGIIYFAFAKEGAKKAARGNKNIIECYLKIQNPVNDENTAMNWYDAEDSSRVAGWKKQGHDGIFVKDESGISIATFTPNQIKSATENVGTFDSENPDIRYSAKHRAITNNMRSGAEKLRQDIGNWRNLVDQYNAGDKEAWKRKRGGRLYKFMDVPLVLQLLNVDFDNINIYGSFFEHSLDQDKHPGMTSDVLKQLPQAISNPLMILKGAKPNSYVFVLELKDENGATVVAPVEINREDKQYGMLKVLNTAYAKTAIDNKSNPDYRYFIHALANGKVLYMNKEKSVTDSQAIRGDSPVGSLSSNALFYESILAFDETKVKNEHDLKALKESNTTMYQAVYHGSPHVFDTFSLEQVLSGEEKQAAVRAHQADIKRSVDEIVSEIKSAYKGARNFKVEGNDITFTMQSGLKMYAKVKERIIVSGRDLEKARKDHGLKDANRSIAIEGFSRKLDRGSLIEISQESRKGTAYHEAFHTVWDWVLTNTEKDAMEAYFGPRAKARGKASQELMADGYRAWQEARRRKQGTIFGKLYQKISDFVKAAQAFFTGADNIHNIYRKIASGDVWKRDVQGRFAKGKPKETQYLVTNKRIVADTLIPVVDISAITQRKMSNPFDYQKRNAWIKSMVGKTFSIPETAEGIGFFNSKKDADHLYHGSGSKHVVMDRVRRKAVSQIDRILQNAIYVEKHPDAQHGKNERWIDFFVPVNDREHLYCIQIQAKEKDTKAGMFTVGKASYYDIKNRGLISTGVSASDTKGGTISPLSIKVADMLRNVKDHMGIPYVTAGQLNYAFGVLDILQEGNFLYANTEKLSDVNDPQFSVRTKAKEAFTKVMDTSTPPEGNETTATGQFAQAMRNTERKDHIQSFKEWTKDKWNNFYVDWIDKNDRVHDLDAAIAQELGRELMADEKVYDRVQTLSASASGMAAGLIEGDEKNITAINKHLKHKKLRHSITLSMVMKKVGKEKMDKLYPDYLQKHGIKNWVNAFGNYLGARRLLEMEKVSHEAYMEELMQWNKDKMSGEKVGKMPEWKGYKFPQGLQRETLLGMIKEAPKEFAEAAEMYYKFNDNILTILEDAGLISEETHVILTTKYKNYCPLMRDFSDTAAADNFIGGLTPGGRGIANVSNMLKRISMEGSERGIINPLEATVNAVSVACNRAERNKVGQMAVNNAMKTGLGNVIKHVQGGVADAKNCIFTVMYNGKKFAFQTTPELYDPIVGYNLPAAGFVLGVARTAARTLRTGATMSPSFIARNFLRDTLFAAISSKHGFKPFVDSIRGMHALLTNGELKAEFESAGVTSFNFYGSAEEIIKSLDEMNGGKLQIRNPKDILKAMMQMFQYGSELVESGTRMGEFMRAREHGASIEVAARAARELTLDFSRSGVTGEKVNQMVPFFNACLQGGDKMIRLIKENPVGTMTKLAEYIVLPSMILWAINHDEPWYQDLDPNIKNTCWILPGGIRIPKPQEAGIFFGSGMEMLLDTMYKTDPVAGKNWVSAFFDAMAPNIIPTVFLPLLEWQANYSFFRGQAIAGKGLERLPDEMQYYAGTAEASKTVGAKLGLSPVKIDNLIRGYTGTMGMFVWQSLMDWTSDEKNNRPAKKLSEMPFIRDMNVTQNNLRRAQDEFYDLVEDAKKWQAGYGKKGSPPPMIAIINRANTLVSKQQKEIREISSSPRVSPGRKRELIAQRQAIINRVAHEMLKRYRDKIQPN